MTAEQAPINTNQAVQLLTSLYRDDAVAQQVFSTWTTILNQPPETVNIGTIEAVTHAKDRPDRDNLPRVVDMYLGADPTEQRVGLIYLLNFCTRATFEGVSTFQKQWPQDPEHPLIEPADLVEVGTERVTTQMNQLIELHQQGKLAPKAGVSVQLHPVSVSSTRNREQTIRALYNTAVSKLGIEPATISTDRSMACVQAFTQEYTARHEQPPTQEQIAAELLLEVDDSEPWMDLYQWKGSATVSAEQIAHFHDILIDTGVLSPLQWEIFRALSIDMKKTSQAPLDEEVIRLWGDVPTRSKFRAEIDRIQRALRNALEDKTLTSDSDIFIAKASASDYDRHIIGVENPQQPPEVKPWVKAKLPYGDLARLQQHVRTTIDFYGLENAILDHVFATHPPNPYTLADELCVSELTLRPLYSKIKRRILRERPDLLYYVQGLFGEVDHTTMMTDMRNEPFSALKHYHQVQLYLPERAAELRKHIGRADNPYQMAKVLAPLLRRPLRNLQTDIARMSQEHNLKTDEVLMYLFDANDTRALPREWGKISLDDAALTMALRALGVQPITGTAREAVMAEIGNSYGTMGDYVRARSTAIAVPTHIAFTNISLLFSHSEIAEYFRNIATVKPSNNMEFVDLQAFCMIHMLPYVQTSTEINAVMGATTDLTRNVLVPHLVATFDARNGRQALARAYQKGFMSPEWLRGLPNFQTATKMMKTLDADEHVILTHLTNGLTTREIQSAEAIASSRYDALITSIRNKLGLQAYHHLTLAYTAFK